MNLKAQLRYYIDKKDLTPAELSRKSGVSKQVLSQWLSGSQPKKLGQVKAVAQVLSVTVDHLCFGEGPDNEASKITEIEALLGDQWISGLFEVRLRRVKRSGESE